MDDDLYAMLVDDEMLSHILSELAGNAGTTNSQLTQDFTGHFTEVEACGYDPVETQSSLKPEARVCLGKPRRSRKAVIAELRQQVAELTKTVQELRQPCLSELVAVRGGSTSTRETELMHRKVSDLLWRGIATRQLHQRQEAERRNKVLRQRMQKQRKERRNLKRMFRRRCDDTLLERIPDIRRCPQYLQTSISDTTCEIRKLLAETRAIYPNTEKLFKIKAMDQVACPGRKTMLQPEVVSGVFLEILDKTHVPFDLQATSKAIWMALKGSKDREGEHVNVKLCSQMIEQNESTTTKHTAFTCVAGESTVYMDEISVAQKYVEQNRILFVSKGKAKPTCLSGGLVGLTVEEIVVIVARKGKPIASGETTIIETYLCATRDDDGRELALKYRGKRFVDIALKGWALKLSIMSQRIENILFDCALAK